VGIALTSHTGRGLLLSVFSCFTLKENAPPFDVGRERKKNHPLGSSPISYMKSELPRALDSDNSIGIKNWSDTTCRRGDYYTSSLDVFLSSTGGIIL
jgi:hypothetical protein